jgi:hypothetical protein
VERHTGAPISVGQVIFRALHAFALVAVCVMAFIDFISGVVALLDLRYEWAAGCLALLVCHLYALDGLAQIRRKVWTSKRAT